MKRVAPLRLAFGGLAAAAVLLTLKEHLLAWFAGTFLYAPVYDGTALAVSLLAALAGFYAHMAQKG